jgi:DNA-binding LacI/PurR family transcriptional regulator
MGHQMTRLLLARIGGDTVTHLSVVLPTRLIIRESS